MERHVVGSAEERTFQYQSVLPSLPVPSLEETLSKYLESVKPFATEEELNTTRAIIERFKNGIGQRLHQKLLERASTRRNWLEEWWLDTAYLEVRMPSQLNVNFGGPTPYLEHCWPPQEGTQLVRTSLSVWHSLQYWDMIRKEKLAVHRSGDEPLDMTQFRMLFNTCKVPGITKDSISYYFKTESEGPCPSHLVVMCRGRIFSFDVLCNGSILSPPELLRQFSYIRQKCDGEAAGEGVQVLTTEERTRWAKAREHLMRLDPKNKAILETIQSSVFLVSLAEPEVMPQDYTQLTLESLTGDPTIRWGDKSYQMLSFANGTFGSNCDHAPFDAMVLVTFCYYLDQQLRASGGQWKGSETVRDIPLPEELVFTIDERVRGDVALARHHYHQSIQDLQIVVFTFTTFGKEAIKKKKLHPDTFVQLALQLAYYRLHGKSGCCYETASTRRFFHGRTETLRPCTVEAQQWCQAMQDPTAAEDTKRKKLMAAYKKHNQLMAEAQNGKGCDRHILGLYLIAKEEGLPVPELYTDPLYSRSGGGGNFVLSTSLVGYMTMVGAVAPMVNHGYGFFYNIRDDRIVVSCTTWKSCQETDAEKLLQSVTNSFHDIMQLATLSQL